jgi:hypothetical protein
MKRLLIAICLLASGVSGAVLGTGHGVALAASGGGQWQTTTTTIVSVDALTAGWTDTGVLVPSGATVTLTATGTANCDYPDCGDIDANGPGGTADSSFTAPGLPVLSLVGMIGTGSAFFVGTGPTTVTGSGELYLAYNDNIYWDNAGGFTVTITTTMVCAPGYGYGDTNHCHAGPPGQP